MESRRRSLVLAVAVGACAWTLLMPHRGEAQIASADGKYKVSGFLEAINIARVPNFSQWDLAQQRNTIQLEADLDTGDPTGIFDEVQWRIIPRGFYDSVYLLNKAEFGKNAGKEPVSAFVAPVAGLLRANGLRSDVFRPLGGRRGGIPALAAAGLGGPVTVDVPVNPDSPLGRVRSYSPVGQDRGDLEKDFELREGYIDLRKRNFPVQGHELFFRIGKQQVVWGESDFFRLADVINPIDFGRRSFLEPFEDTRIPLWIAQATYKFGTVGPIEDLAIEADWIFDEFEPAGLGQRGQPYANVFSNAFSAFSLLNEIYGPNSIIGLPTTEPVYLSGSEIPAYTVENTQYGGRILGTWERINFTLNFLYRFQDVPALELKNIVAPLILPTDPPRAILPIGAPNYHIVYPRTYVYGFTVTGFEPYSEGVIRLEANLEDKAGVVDTSQLDNVQTTPILRWVLGYDRSTFIRFLNPTRTFFLSGQVFHTHIVEHTGNAHGDEQVPDAILGTRNRGGTADAQDRFIFTGFAQGFYWSDTLIPVGFFAYDAVDDALALGATLQYLFSNHIDATIGFTQFLGHEKIYDTGPLGVVAAPPPGTDSRAAPGQIRGTSRVPFGLVKEFFGAERNEDELIARIRYRF